MFCLPPGSAQDKYSTRTVFLQGMALTTTLLGLLLCNACAGFSAPANGNSTAGSNSTGSLTISATLPSGVVGSSYTVTLNVSGGTAPYSFAIASGELPAGLLLGSTTGTILGTPTTPGSFSFAISVSDSTGLSKNQSLQIAVAAESVPGNSFSNLQQSGGWGTYGLTPPSYATCSPSPCD